MDLSGALQSLATEARELYLDHVIAVLETIPSPLSFYRNYVSANKPVIIKGGVQHWHALSKWNNDYLRNALGDAEVTVAVTPNGYADAVHNGKFLLPEERVMSFASFLDILDKGADDCGVYYVQKQNSNFTDEFYGLMNDAEPHLSWATEAFGKSPDAVNFWMGEANAVTSLHKDHYENVYAVVRGQKTFTLYPPTDQPFIPYKMFPCARYVVSEGSSHIIDVVSEGSSHTIDMVPWIPVDVENPDLDSYPEFAHAQPLIAKVGAGDVLYLPSLWYHHVRQSHGCIAVNFWYDMEYDIRYNYYKFVEKLLNR